ncbi:hypothetical protein L3Q82_005281 [Scortum barcoo]|uniref:Uncharacterized protein n=1 Tax=Scortum barcoo TaxID=214431 RepID=A0ACB8VA29_9TELE|nr:hypothetical protein L3Q82_005281 [Scortum barcoo]
MISTQSDGISSRLLKSCADQLCGIFGYTFNLSLKLGRVPQLWKTSCIVPVPKTPHPKELNSYRPVALTSHLMKTLERLVLAHLRPLVVSSLMDPLQFAYQPDIGVDDAVIYLLHTSLTHLEKAGSTVRIMFFDFSSAFNTIQPRLLGDKLQLAGIGMIEYKGLIQNFVDWCLWNNLQMSAGKTKELVVDFRTHSHSPPAPVNILGMDINVVKPYKYLGLDSLDCHLLWDSLLGQQQHHGQGQEENGQTAEEGPALSWDAPWNSVEVVGNGRMMAKLSSLLNNTSHPLQDSLTALGSSFSERLLHPRCVKERSKQALKSILTQACLAHLFYSHFLSLLSPLPPQLF